MQKILILTFVLTSFSLYSQEDTTVIKKTELSIMGKLSSLSVMKSDKLQNQVNDSIIEEFKTILHIPASFYYPFDSLKSMGKVMSDDENIRFYTWNVPYQDGSHYIACILQYKVFRDSLNVIVLKDKFHELSNIESAILSPNNWYGAMYYEIIEEKINRQKYYFVLGYNPGNLFSNIKVIDVFYFDEYGQPFFGKPFFNLKNKTQNRVILEYNEKASITLHYNKKVKMIVFHHLAPIDNKYKGNPAFYGPDFTFDGFEFKNDMWNLTEKVDVRNENY